MVHEQIEKNKRKTILIVLLFFVIYMLVAASLGYLWSEDILTGLVLGSVVGVVYAVFTIKSSNKRIIKMSSGETMEKSDNPQLFNVVEEVCIQAGVPMPTIILVDSPSPNAFASGLSPDKALVGVTTGLLDILTREELEGVIAHEIAHIQNYDIRLNTIVVAMVASIMFMGRSAMRSRRRISTDKDNGSLMIVSLIAILVGMGVSKLVQLTLSRNREYLADATAVEITRNPDGLIGALQKIEGYTVQLNDERSSYTGDEDSYLLDGRLSSMYILDPGMDTNQLRAISKKEKDSLFSTHPATSNRIQKLQESLS